MQQGNKFHTIASADLVGTRKRVLQGQQALLPILWRASVGLLDRLALALHGALFELIDNEGEEEGHGKDGDKEVDNQSKIRGHPGPQALHSGVQALPDPCRALAAIETV